jgi:hypothetical protein
MKVVETGGVTVQLTGQEVEWLVSLADFPLHEDIRDEGFKQFLREVADLALGIAWDDHLRGVRRVEEVV